MLRSAAGKILGGQLGAGIMTGAGDADEMLDELALRPDMDNRKKALTALGRGTVEGVGTALEVGALDKLPDLKGLGRASNILKGAGSGAIENGISEWIERGLDNALNGELSERELNKGLYMLQGKSEEEADELARKDQNKKIWTAAALGGLFGGGSRAFQEIGNKIKGVPTLEAEEPKVKAEEPEVDTEEPSNIIPFPGKKTADVETPESSETLQTSLEVIEDKTRFKGSLIEQKNAIKRDKSNYRDGKLTPEAEKKISQIDEQIKRAQYEIQQEKLWNKLGGTFRQEDELKGKGGESDNVVPFPGKKTVEPSTKEPNTSNIVKTPTQNTEVPEGGDKIRSFSKRGSMDENLPDEVREVLAGDYYKVARNADTETRANELFDPENLAQTRSNLDQALEKRDPASALLSYKLAGAYVDEGNYDAATDVMRLASEKLTEAGQFTQAAKLAMMKNDPMAALRSYMRDLDDLNEWGRKKYGKKWNDIALSEEDMDAFNNIQTGDAEGLSALVDSLNAKYGKEIPASAWEKFVGATKVSMLLNPRTQGRNVLANMAMLPIKSTADRVSAVGQNIVHLFNPDMKVTQSVTGGTKAQKEIATQVFEREMGDILGDNKMKDSVKGDILKHRQIFNDDALATWIDNHTNGAIQKLNQKFGADGNKSTMETLANFTYWLMDAKGDQPFVKKNFVNRLASYMKAQGINNIEDIPDEAIAIAKEEALKATFKDDNKFTKAIQGVKQKTGKFGEVALPFTKTPANLTMRAVDYSPAGLYNTIKKIKSGAEASTVVDELSKNLTGTALIYLGYKLREKGLLSGSYSDDPDEAAFQKRQGMLENAFHVGDNYYTFDWSQPAATPLIIGSVIADAVANSDKENMEIKDIVNATFKGGLDVANSLISSSPVQSLADILGGNSYNGNGIAGRIAQEMIEMPERLVPSVMGATARAIDPVQRDIYNKDDSLTGILGNQLLSAQSKVPFLSKTLPAAYDTWGQEKMRSDAGGEAAFAQFVNPGQLGNDTSIPIDKDIQAIYEATGDKQVFPINAPRSLNLGNDGTLNLTNKQHSEYQKTLGQMSRSFAETLIASDEFKSMSNEDKAKMLGNAYSFANQMSKEQLFDHVTDQNKQLKEAYKSGGVDGAVKYMLDKAKADSLGISYDKYTKLENESPGMANVYAADKDTAAQMGFVNKDGNVNMESFEKAKTMVGDSVPALNFYKDFQAQDFSSMAEKIPYVIDNTDLTDAQKGMLITNQTDPTKLKGKVVNSMYEMGGWEGVYYWYVLKNLADTDGNGSVKKAERNALLNSDNPYVTQLPDDMYYYLGGVNW